MTQHTKWHIKTNGKDVYIIDESATANDVVCDVLGTAEQIEERSRLIAASPRLLALAQAVSFGQTSHEMLIDMAKAAIASATVQS